MHEAEVRPEASHLTQVNQPEVALLEVELFLNLMALLLEVLPHEALAQAQQLVLSHKSLDLLQVKLLQLHQPNLKPLLQLLEIQPEKVLDQELPTLSRTSICLLVFITSMVK